MVVSNPMLFAVIAGWTMIFTDLLISTSGVGEESVMVLLNQTVAVSIRIGV
jgi:hypothetical protein